MESVEKNYMNNLSLMHTYLSKLLQLVLYKPLNKEQIFLKKKKVSV